MRTRSNPSRDHRGDAKMMFSDDGKIIILNYLDEIGISAYEIWKWKYRSIKSLLSRSGSMDKQKGAGPPRTTNAEENAKLAEESICSQEEGPSYPSSSKLKHAIMSLIISRDSSHLNSFVSTLSALIFAGPKFCEFREGQFFGYFAGIKFREFHE